MKDSPVSTQEEKKSRRGLLALIGAGGAAAAAALLGHRNGAEAAAYEWSSADGDAAGLFNNTGTGDGVRGDTTATSVWSKAGVHGKGTNVAGVYGESTNWAGIRGRSTNSDGIRGDADGSGNGVAGLGRIGVKGTGKDAGISVGVKGEANVGKVGTWGYANGVGKEGVRATGAGGAWALLVQGRAAFSNAGSIIMKKGEKVKLVTIGGEIGPNDIILGTLQAWPGNFVCVRYCGRVSAHSFYIVLTGELARNVRVGYMIIA